MDNTSGLGKSSIVPDEIKGWCWGAFFLGFIWGLSNRTYISLLCATFYLDNNRQFERVAKYSSSVI